MTAKKIVVIGSLNLDHTLTVPHLPTPGMTLAVTSSAQAPGGKGANQAVAAARSGADVMFIGRVGDDEAGRVLVQALSQEPLDQTYLKTLPEQVTGQAYIMLEPAGQNEILIQSGANGELLPEAVQEAAAVIETADAVIGQFEVPLETTLTAFTLARQAGVTTILNPAPAQDAIPAALLAVTDMILPNETEAAAITGVAPTDQAAMQASADFFHAQGVNTVIITLGHHGAYLSAPGHHLQVPAFAVTAVDTTAAGDTFIGALAAELHPDGANLLAAVRYASMAAACAVQKLGAFPAIPLRTEVTQALEVVSE